MKFEVCFQFSVDVLNGFLGLGCKSYHPQDRNDDFDIVFLVDPDAVVTPDFGEPYLLKNIVQLLVPNTWGLMQTIKSLEKLEEIIIGSLVKSFWLLHIDFLLQVTIQEYR